MNTFIVAELSGNHRGEISSAKEIIEAAADAGADAVKLQTYTADTITFDGSSELFQTSPGTLWEGRSMYELYQEASTPWEWHPELFEFARSLGLEIFSSPFDLTAVDFLESIGTSRYKIASPEAMDYPLIRHTASLLKPMIISTGMASLQEIEEAVQVCFEVGNQDVTLLKCTSQYPAPISEMNLATIPDLFRRFGPDGVKVGLSDHSMHVEPAIAAVAMGSVMVEKHLTLDRKQGGVDSGFSLNPDEFSALVTAIRNTELAMGSVEYLPNEPRKRGARSLFAVEDIRSGDLFTKENVRSIRPSNGLHPRHYEQVLGNRATRDLPAGTPLEVRHLADAPF